MSQATLFSKTQTEKLLDWLNKHKDGITSLEAYEELGITQLARCIDDLQKDGHRFTKTWEVTANRKHIKRYKLIKE